MYVAVKRCSASFARVARMPSLGLGYATAQVSSLPSSLALSTPSSYTRPVATDPPNSHVLTTTYEVEQASSFQLVTG